MKRKDSELLSHFVGSSFAPVNLRSLGKMGSKSSDKLFIFGSVHKNVKSRLGSFRVFQVCMKMK